MVASGIHGPTVRPSDRPPGLVEALNVGSREVDRGDVPIVLAGAGPAHGAPLAEPHSVPPPRARRHESRHLAAVLRDLQLKRRAAEQLIRLGAQRAEEHTSELKTP